MSLLTCSYIGELRSGRKFKCDSEPFIVLILILRKSFVLDLIKKKQKQFELTAVGGECDVNTVSDGRRALKTI